MQKENSKEGGICVGGVGVQALLWNITAKTFIFTGEYILAWCAGCLSQVEGSERRLAHVPHVGPGLGRLEGGQGPVGPGEREGVRLGQVGARPRLRCGELSVWQLVPLVLLGQLHTHAHVHTQTHTHARPDRQRQV